MNISSTVRAAKSPLLQTYLHLIQSQTYSPLYSLCTTKEHTTQHLYECHKLHTTLTTNTLWTDPQQRVSSCLCGEVRWMRVVALLARRQGRGQQQQRQ